MGKLSLLAVLLVLAGCSGESAVFEPQQPAMTLVVVSGSGQSVSVGSEPSDPIVARLTTNGGAPVANAWIKIMIWGPTPAGSGGLVAVGWPSAQTDAEGVVSARHPVDARLTPGAGLVTLEYEVCVRPGFKDCAEYEKRASTSLPITLLPG